MKALSIFILVISLFSLMSCSDNNKNEISADEILEKTIESKYYRISNNSVVFKKNGEPIKVINDSIDSFIKSEIRIFINSIDDDIKELIDNDETSGKYRLNIVTEHFITTYGFISTIIELNHYTLGAHGNSVFKSINYDIVNKKFINLSDLFNTNDNNKLEQFNKLLNRYLVNTDSCFTIKPEIDNSFNTFTIQEDSIAVYFAPYELGAYACGSAEILIPINELP
jgi:hypothetical protein